MMQFGHAIKSSVIDISCGEEHSALLTKDGEVFTFGYGMDGQLGHKEKNNLNQPKKLAFDKRIKKVACGGGHTGIVTE
jgi:alpha-tubulin suppressor-like RCC1 family protein